MDAYKNVMDMMGGNSNLPDRRKNQPLREVFDKLNNMFYRELQQPCLRCHRIVMMPKGHALCLDCTPVSEGGNYET